LSETFPHVVYGCRVGVERDGRINAVYGSDAAVAAVSGEPVRRVLNQDGDVVRGLAGDRSGIDAGFRLFEFVQASVGSPCPYALRSVDQLERKRKLLRILRIGQLALGVYGKGVFRFRIESALGDFQYVGSDFGPLRLVVEFVGIADGAFDGLPCDDDLVCGFASGA